jgi:hypothetical protein
LQRRIAEPKATTENRGTGRQASFSAERLIISVW